MLSIVIPAFNEEDRLQAAIRKTLDFLVNQSFKAELIIVCDGCTDNTAEISRKFINENTNIRVIEYSPNRGKGYAVKTGVMNSNGDQILFMDADLSVPVNTITAFTEQINNGYDIIIGARNHKDTIILEHQMFLRELAGKLFGQIQKFILKIPFDDTQCGFKMFKKEAAIKLFSKIKYDCSYFDAEIIYLAYNGGLKIKEMPVTWKHDGITRMPIGISRTIDLLKKLFKLKSLHKIEQRNK
jgi:dolichyl-phosphate beta-glucosyltransferase